MLAVLLQIVLVVLLVVAVGGLMKMDPRFEAPWLPAPVPFILALWMVCFFVLSFLVSMSTSFFKPTASWFSVNVVWAVVAVVSSVYVAGTSYLFLMPVLCSIACGLIGIVFGGKTRAFAMLGLAVVAAAIWLPYERAFYDAIGLKLISFQGLRMAFILTALLPFLVELPPRTTRAIAWLFLVGFLVCSIAAVFLNPTP